MRTFALAKFFCNSHCIENGQNDDGDDDDDDDVDDDYRYLPITHANRKNIVLECSAKPRFFKMLFFASSSQIVFISIQFMPHCYSCVKMY